MSCYQVNSDTINLIASAILWTDRQVFIEAMPETYYLGEMVEQVGETASVVRPNANELELVRAIGIELIRANIKSVMERYGDETMISYQEHEHTPEVIKEWQGIADISDILGALSCYDYQACEAEDYRQSWASGYITEIRRNLCAKLSEDKWEYEKPEGASKLVRII